MIKKSLVLLFGMALLAMGQAQASAPEPPPEGSLQVGPAIIGTVTVTPDGTGVTVNFDGTCKGTQVVSIPKWFDVAFADVTAAGMEGSFLQGAGAEAGADTTDSCYVSNDLIINTVRKFVKKGQAIIIADVVLLFVR